MHNTHFIIVNAFDPEEAESTVNSNLTDWGTEDNWFDILSVNNLTNPNDDERKLIEDCLKDLNEFTSKDKVQDIIESIDKYQAQLNTGERHIYWCLSDLYKKLYEITGVTSDYTIENLCEGECNDFNGFQYDEFGLTDISAELDENEQLYFVEVNMHS